MEKLYKALLKAFSSGNSAMKIEAKMLIPFLEHG